MELRKLASRTVAKLVEEVGQRLQSRLEAHASGQHTSQLSRMGRDRSDQVVGQQMHRDFLSHHLRGLAAQLVHLHDVLDGTEIQLHMPTAVLKSESGKST